MDNHTTPVGCACPTCIDPQAAVQADLAEACTCDAQGVCLACATARRMAGLRPCDRCDAWVPAASLTRQPGGEPPAWLYPSWPRQLCESCWEEWREGVEEER